MKLMNFVAAALLALSLVPNVRALETITTESAEQTFIEYCERKGSNSCECLAKRMIELLGPRKVTLAVVGLRSASQSGGQTDAEKTAALEAGLKPFGANLAEFEQALGEFLAALFDEQASCRE